MDPKVFWLIVFALIGLTGSVLTFARRHNNPDVKAGTVIAGLTVFLLFLWLLGGEKLLN